MTDTPEQRLSALGITLPEPVAPVANYAPAVVAGGFLYVSGQIPIVGTALAFEGQVGAALSVEDAQKAARLCGINILSHARAAAGGSLDSIAQVVRLGGFVVAAPDFIAHPQVVNGASDLMVEVFGAAGKHARVAAGVSSLPLGAPVEVDAILRLA